MEMKKNKERKENRFDWVVDLLILAKVISWYLHKRSPLFHYPPACYPF
jgi:hypothetical protein